MKKVGVCENCGRSVYTNDLDLCKRCNNLVGVEAQKEHDAEVGPEEEEEMPSLEGLDLGEETKEEGKKEEKKEEPKEEEKPAEEKSEEKKEE